jgi:hypothetical protein
MRRRWAEQLQLWAVLSSTDEPVVLEPGALRKFVLVQTAQPRLLPQRSVYAFATDALGRTSWSPTEVESQPETPSWAAVDAEPVSIYDSKSATDSP